MIERLRILFIVWISLFIKNVNAADFLIEAESFLQKGGWVIDQQFMDQMGSPYLLAHGMGVPVSDAVTDICVPNKGEYYIYVRTYNWTSPWCKNKGPGRFALYIDGKEISSSLGIEGEDWMWQFAGHVRINKAQVEICLKDLTGFDGRCDAIYFTQDANKTPPASVKGMKIFRKQMYKDALGNLQTAHFDLVVVGGGTAGISTALSAARLGCKVALIHDRPILGGNNSSEVRVHLGASIEMPPYPKLGGLVKEYGPVRGGNAQPGEYYEDQKKLDVVNAEKNISLFLNFHATEVELNGKQIKAVRAIHIETGKEKVFEAPLFADCTGDGNIGFLAGADYRMGREGRMEFGESLAPEQADSLTMGASVQWYSKELPYRSSFPLFEYGLTFDENKCEKVTMGEWQWEVGMNLNQITEAERIRDYGLLVVYSNWSYLKNRFKKDNKWTKRKLSWVAYVAGKRESRRLLGDYILKQDDIDKQVFHEDATVTTTWAIDLHVPDSTNIIKFPNAPFLSSTKHIYIKPYPIPYRCLYSRNVENLFMAGRNISATHVTFGSTRLMRTTAMMGEVVGMAASICRKHQVLPREVYWWYMEELKRLMEKGVGKPGIPNNQKYNEIG